MSKNKDFYNSKEWRKKQRDSHMGQVAWNKGKHWPESTKIKLSLYRKGRLLSEETKKKISLSLKGRIISEEHKRKISVGRTGKKLSEEGRRKISLSRIGIISWNAGKKNVYTQSQLQRISSSVKKLWQNPEYAKMMFEKQGKKPNKEELYLDALLQLNFPKEWKYVGDGQVWIAGKNPDFINKNNKKLLIEYNGFYKHTFEKDEQKADHYAKYGYKTLNLYPKDLEDQKSLIEKIRKELLDYENAIVGNNYVSK